MRRWLQYLSIALAAGAIAFFAAPKRESREITPQDLDPTVATARALLRARNDTLRAWNQVRNEAIAVLAARRAPRGTAPVAVSTFGEITEATRRAYLTALDNELRTLPEPPRVPIRLVVVGDTSRNTFTPVQFVRPTAAGEPCVIVVRLLAQRDRSSIPRAVDRRLGVCGLYARYGMPGKGIAAWLDSTRSVSAATDSVTTKRDPFQERFRASAAGSNVLRVLPLAACAAGRDEACDEAMLDPFRRQRPLPRIPAESYPQVSGAFLFDFNSWPGDVTARLREHLGDDRFARWWRSELAPEAAYAYETGEPFAEFAQRYLEPYVESHRPGPLHAGLPLLLGLSLAVGLSWWAIRGTPRARS